MTKCTSALVLSCKIAEFFQNAFSQENLYRAASEFCFLLLTKSIKKCEKRNFRTKNRITFYAARNHLKLKRVNQKFYKKKTSQSSLFILIAWLWLVLHNSSQI